MKVSRVCPTQMKKLLDLLSKDGVLVNGKVMYTNTNKQNFWKRIAVQLNNVEGGVYKNTWKWCKTWADWKNKTKKKVNLLLKKKSFNEEQTYAALTDLELRLLKMINYPLDGKFEQIKQEMSDDKLAVPEDGTEGAEKTRYPNEDSNEHKHEIFFEDSEFHGNNCYNTNDMISEENEIAESSSGTDRKEKVKINGRSLKRRKMTIEEYDKKITLKLEKERLAHKTEELRLKAVELKLKGDELKLKEVEMNKINYLTTIEEEKLKCFKEISMSLKELLGQTRSGNLRFSNSFE